MQPPRKDYLDGDHSFKNWFRIMWSNFYIQLFIIISAGLIYLLCKEEDLTARIVGGSILGAALIVIAYKGFYQFWQDLKKGQSR